MRFSLVVTTIGRVDDLRLLFQSLIAQGVSDYELLLIDQNKDDRLVPLVKEFGDACHIRHLPLKTAGACRGRNAGLDQSTGEIVGFPDDDCELAPDFLKRMDQTFRDRPDVDGLTTNTHARDRHVELGPWDGGVVTLDKVSVMDRCAEFTTYLRRASVATERYDEQWGPGSGTPWGADEGPDFMIRLMNRGKKIVFFPNLVVYHPEKNLKVDRAILKRSFSYSRGRGHCYRLHALPVKPVAVSLIRSFGGVVVNAAKLDGKRAAYYGVSLAGKVRGLFDGRRGTLSAPAR